MLKLLIIEDDQLCYHALESLLSGHEIHWARESTEARKLIEGQKFDWALIDVDLDYKGAGLELCQLASQRGIHSTIVSGHRDRNFTLRALKQGASEILSKPFAPSEFKELLLDRVRSAQTHTSELERFLDCATDRGNLKSRELYGCLSQELPVLLTGESGTGKTRLAKLIHQEFKTNKAFVHVNCAEITDALAESILFGHAKGAFSGADCDRIGLIESAEGGTLFLDEVATLSSQVQAKLLKVLEEKTFRRVGEHKERRANFQLISATCESFEQVRFRKDLLYRLSGLKIHLLALRNTKGLALEIAENYLENSSRRMILDDEAREYLKVIDLSGNVRELLAGLKRVRSTGKILIEEQDLIQVFGTKVNPALNRSLKSQVSHFEREIVERVFKKCGENVRKTLRELEITSTTFYRVMNLPSTVI